MSNKYTPGVYQVIIFNELGSRKKKMLTAASLTLAEAKAKKYLDKHQNYSTVVTRVLQNSLYSKIGW